MSRTPLPWFESLTDSVFALGAAARETRTAHQAAQAAAAQYDLGRIRLLDGAVTIPGPPSFPVRPHDRAVMGIGKALQECRDRMERLYTEAALGYAYGTAWAILRVLDDQEPPRVELGLTAEGHLTIPGELAPIPPTIEGLYRWRDNAKLEQARQRWWECDSAGEYASALDDEDYLADHEAYEMHQAYDEARGLADAAYAYGVLAESALRYALLGARARHTHL
ncbi:hypothetical protein EDD98_0916 [Streptomyces sp. PanSC19]|uniref:hypothetical protein n=1 Tax=Streptomyces sp. PanSC19 TaxID=1520455 RepID=UPI000F4ACF05|nr:hypothetical protein [Streptomyces sp. PanSC19]ROQ31949.1 hypothetical protein EDD98_0916 [Streptomyces sp. PanSC19]